MTWRAISGRPIARHIHIDMRSEFSFIDLNGIL